MRSKLLMLAPLAVFAVSATVAAQSADELLKSKGCGTCHAPDTKKVGPSFKDISAKYKGDAGAADKIVTSLKAAKGHPKVNATDAELKTMVTHVLATK
jgi:cytochrome c